MHYSKVPEEDCPLFDQVQYLESIAVGKRKGAIFKLFFKNKNKIMIRFPQHILVVEPILLFSGQILEPCFPTRSRENSRMRAFKVKYLLIRSGVPAQERQAY